ncbi:facilitated trehalose transporter Tret1-like isoform X1 [Microplitis mediator]|uniref:facilitated trehalose transporter Tret1-like isoform X1 n=2 Tax=Microplitis mediator TaxID=375433 RepID=UPI002555DEC8|nr:facilitated trehalose transporter Tret1-like isoform X1 [Microplitis mediator]
MGKLDPAAVAQFYYGFFSMTSLVASGMSMGFSSIGLPVLTSNSSGFNTLALLNGHEDAATWFASIISIAIPFGCIASVFTMRAGRKIAMISSGAISLLGWILIATSYSIPQLLIGRFITGFATGLGSIAAPVYVSEIAAPKYRTSLTAATNVFISFGILLIYFFGYIIPNNWRLVSAVVVILPIFSMTSIIFFLPESPRWLLTNGSEAEAKSSLLTLRGLNFETNEFLIEFDQMIVYHGTGTKVFTSGGQSKPTKVLTKIKEIWDALKKPEVWKPFLILNTFFLLQQFCGIYVVIAYAVDMVVKSGIAMDPFMVTVLIGLTQTIAAVVITICSSRMGRKLASIISATGMSVSLAVLAICLNFEVENSVILLVALFTFIATGSFGFLPLPWAMIGELYPTKYVNFLAPITACIEGFLNFASIQIYPPLAKWDFTATIYLYCSVSIVSILFIVLILPETHGRTKTQIEHKFKS